MNKKLLLISNSTMFGEAYLDWTKKYIADFLNAHQVNNVLFVPYAGVGLSDLSLKSSYEVYTEKVRKVYAEFGIGVTSVHTSADPIQAVLDAEAVVVGGGNTFHLIAKMHETGIMPAVQQKAEDGMPFMGWSAGANVACPGLFTTNDMPIVEPISFSGLNLLPFQINPHYLDANPEGHGGETRQQRIEEYLVVNRNMKVVGLREASMLLVEGKTMKLQGSRPMRLFEFGKEAVEFEPGSDLSFLL